MLWVTLLTTRPLGYFMSCGVLNCQIMKPIAVLLLMCTCLVMSGPGAQLQVGQDEVVALVRVAGGEFLMDCPTNPPSPWQPDETEIPLHPVRVSTFYVSKYPITVAQFCEYLNATGLKKQHAAREVLLKSVQMLPKSRFLPKEGRAHRPVAGITRSGARAFCNWLSQASGKRCRLPTEAEWEYAAKGQENRTYPWGSKTQQPPREWLPDVGRLPGLATPDGVHDLAGSVYQWCDDEFDPRFYIRSPREAPACRAGDGRYVLRGGPGIRTGVWENTTLVPNWRRFASRDSDVDSTIGFRIVVECAD
jgi:formylglycine-generating enzyme required for sulfatase activity